jgi:hypothetical protein
VDLPSRRDSQRCDQPAACGRQARTTARLIEDKLPTEGDGGAGAVSKYVDWVPVRCLALGPMQHHRRPLNVPPDKFRLQTPAVAEEGTALDNLIRLGGQFCRYGKHLTIAS